METGIRPWLLTLPMPPRARGYVLRAFGAKVGHNVRVHPLRVMNVTWRHLDIADDCYVGLDVLLDLSEHIVLERGAVIGPRATLLTHQNAGEAHRSPTTARVPTFARPLVIGEYAFVGAGALVLAGCDVGAGGIVGAGAVVTRAVPEGALVAGNPAKPPGGKELPSEEAGV